MGLHELAPCSLAEAKRMHVLLYMWTQTLLLTIFPFLSPPCQLHLQACHSQVGNMVAKFSRKEKFLFPTVQTKVPALILLVPIGSYAHPGTNLCLWKNAALWLASLTQCLPGLRLESTPLNYVDWEWERLFLGGKLECWYQAKWGWWMWLTKSQMWTIELFNL